MVNLERLFEYNQHSNIKIRIKGKKVIFSDKSGRFSGETILKIIDFANSLHKMYKNINIPIVFSFGDVEIADKLSYILFECICYFLMTKYRHVVYVYWRPKPNILTDGIFSSPLKLLNEGTHKAAMKYPDKFKRDLYQNHFRKIISCNQRETNYLGELFQELDSFLKYFSIVEEYRDQITEVIAELVGNACEHAKADCLLDIDITSDHRKTVENIPQDGKFYGINIVVVDFSEVLLGSDIKTKLHTKNFASERYAELEKAYEYHRKNFSDKYTEDDFCNVSALQDKISGRLDHSESGGTGLTKLIHSLQEKSEVDSCYVASGDRCIMFRKEMLEYNKQNWLGFNKERDFINTIPDRSVNMPCYAYIPGTAYNLNFVMKREVI